jgi:hypothetical protein
MSYRSILTSLVAVVFLSGIAVVIYDLPGCEFSPNSFGKVTYHYTHSDDRCQ